MSIMGNVVGVPTPRADWAQTDPAKADFIRNKPDLTTLDQGIGNTMAVARAALPKSGGTMTGELDMGGCPLSGLPAPREARDAVTKEYADGKHKYLTIHVPASGWVTHETFRAYQRIINGDILETDNPHYGLVLPEGYAADTEKKFEEFAKIDYLQTENGQITLYAFWDVPGADLYIQLEVNR